jgi:hypothetical protein
MNIPRFTALSSLYRAGHYYTAGSRAHGTIPNQSAVFTQAGGKNCDKCEVNCNLIEVQCEAGASASYAIAVLGCGAFLLPPAVAACEAIAAGAYAGAVAACYATEAVCLAKCWWPGEDCCPVFCELGHCCDEGESCFSGGCCPNAVCGGNCCFEGDKCCGDACCPSQFNCCGTTCCELGVPCCGDQCCSLLPPPGPPPPPPATSCGPGSAPCGFPDSSGVIRTCCPPGLQCCNFYQGVPDCRTSCLN